MVKLNKVKERYIYLSPTVQAGWEDESNIADFEQLKVLGKGAFGKVTKCVHKRSKLVYAIKEIDKRNLKENNMVEQMTNEVKIMYQLNHPNILKLYNHFEDERNIYLVLELATGGQMYQVLWRQPGKRFSEQRAANYIFQLCLALQKCHTNEPSIIHRDIKPENLLFDANNQVKLADFGWSNFLPKSKDVRETFCGTLDYLAPEMLTQSHSHDCTVDIWSVGVLTFELLTGMSPFAPTERQFNAEYVDMATRQNIKSIKMKFPNEFPPLAKDLVQKVLVKETNARLTLQAIMTHPWIAQYCQAPPAQENSSFEMDRAKQIAKSVDLDGIDTTSNKSVIFTNDQIYAYSRPDSIINKDFDANNKQNAFSKQGTMNLDQSIMSNASNLSNSTQADELRQKLNKDLQEKNKKLEQKVNALSVSNDKKQMEIEVLKKQLALQSNGNKTGGDISSNSSQELVTKLKASENKYIQLKTENDFQWGKLMESEKKNRDLQAQLNFQGNSDETSKKMIEYKNQCDSLKRQLELVQSELNTYKKQGSGVQKPQQSGQQSQKTAELDGFLNQLKQKHQQGMSSNDQQQQSQQQQEPKKNNYF